MLTSLRTYLAAGCLIGALSLSAGSIYAQDNKEYLVKAAFIYNFTKFVEWPGDKAISKQSSVDVCMVGDSGMAETAAVFKKASTVKLSISLVREKNISNLGHCHIVFISGGESGKLPGLLEAMKGRPILTVSDIDDFAEQGGMIGFVMVGDNIKLAANTKVAAASGLRIDAQLLEVAHQVIDK